MIVLGHGGVMKKVYELLEYGVLNEEAHLLNFMDEDRICEDSSIKNACIEDG